MYVVAFNFSTDENKKNLVFITSSSNAHSYSQNRAHTTKIVPNLIYKAIQFLANEQTNCKICYVRLLTYCILLLFSSLSTLKYVESDVLLKTCRKY